MPAKIVTPGETNALRISAAINNHAGLIDAPPTAVQGTTTNDNAAAGYVGELLSTNLPSGSAVSLTTDTITNITTLSLTAGDWDVWATLIYAGSGNTSRVLGYMHTASAPALPTAPNEGAYMDFRASFAASAAQSVPIGQRRYSLAVTTTIYLIAYATFTVSMTCYGYIGAWRVR
jgi:hypothetical protein